MRILSPKLYFFYLSKLYIKNLLSILFGLSFAFAAIDYFQYAQKLDVSGSYQILYIFYMWEQALGLLYPLAIIFALIMTKLSLIRNNTMGALHAFGYSRQRLVLPLLVVSILTYLIFTFLHTTEFSYAGERGELLLKNEINAYNVNNLFFKYDDTFVYIDKLDPITKTIEGITIFKVAGYQVRYTIKSPRATFNGHEWDAEDATIKTHIYQKGKLVRYDVEHQDNIRTLEGYKPKIIESLYEGKALNIIDAYNTWKLLEKQNLNSDKIRAILYDKVIVPLFSIALLVIFFFKLPFHARIMNIGSIIALSLSITFMIWGILFGLNQIGTNGVLIPEVTVVFPILLLWGYAGYVYFLDENSIQ
jgi:lipopolysaccharide export system permease protein